jgi:5-methylthioadenosine/S-adenosylhomocysteine deaminase
MLLGGTTCFLDMYFHEAAVADVVERTGIRAVLSTTLMGDSRARFEQDFEALAARYPAGGAGRITLMAAAHSPYTCSREDLLYVKGVAEKYGCGVNIHVAETREEMDMVREQTGTSPVRYLDSLGLLDRSTVAVHCVHVDGEDIEIFHKRGVSVSHNPQSNMKLASGVCPAAKMLGAGVNVAIGTDGASSNNDLDMWEEMRSASFLQKVTEMDSCALPAWETLKMATVNGAKALGLGNRIGQLKEGMLADIIMVDMQKPHMQPQTDVIANLVYCAKAADVDTVIVDGKVVVQGGRLSDADLPELYRRAGERVEEIAKEVAGGWKS